jgi:hypothetical protein
METGRYLIRTPHMGKGRHNKRGATIRILRPQGRPFITTKFNFKTTTTRYCCGFRCVERELSGSSSLSTALSQTLRWRRSEVNIWSYRDFAKLCSIPLSTKTIKLCPNPAVTALRRRLLPVPFGPYNGTPTEGSIPDMRNLI